ncbi:HupE/UreJ family protein [Carboxylicivirga marina]|uniref:HupE/UreJ family protein n=1 Tax=Carboxylicivirga marina TaxID=2800988 RepID=A0ABS1HJE1_9BACT|nr:HupE/UreJ family protein [Carboxylicivirga marina]MBK3517803.1 HupE/UreJ family protein [Carboxylicivirga marina]
MTKLLANFLTLHLFDNAYLKSLNNGLRPILLLIVIFCFSSPELYADDPGIAKVRLIQKSDTTYIFEVDIPQVFLGSFKEPILPQGFNISTPSREFQSEWVTLKAEISSSNRGFEAEDVLLLPWARNAVDITAQWLDGKTFKGFFTRTLNGIHVPLNQIMEVQYSTTDLLKTYFVTGLKHYGFKWIHVLFVLCLVLAMPNRKAYRMLLYFALGQMTAMLLAEMRIIGFELLFGDLVVLLLVIYTSYHLYRAKKAPYLPALIFFTALIHGLSFGNELQTENLLMTQRIQAMFAFNLAIDLGNYSLGSLLLIVVYRIKRISLRSTYLPMITGSLAVFCILFLFEDNILADKKQTLDFQNSGQEVMVQTSTNNPIEGATGVSKSKGFMTSPIMVFLSVEPYEARKEILIKGSELVRILKLKTKKNMIPAEQQEEIKARLEQLISTSDTTYINNHQIKAEKVNVNFVTLGRGGVSIKETAVDEDINEAIIGISLNYLMDDYPDSIRFAWHLFPDNHEIDLSMVDPHATSADILCPDNNMVTWESRIKGFKVPAIEPIEVKNRPIPIVSYGLWLILAIVFIILWYYRREKLEGTKNRICLLSLLILGFALFPFARPVLAMNAISHGKPSVEKGERLLGDLLTNVYRAFDRKQEDVVYDRLAMSVTNEQLVEIYLQNRESMALENRGGARATVDEVNITELHKLSKLETNIYKVDIEWKVRGSVNHFGHTHYRQNKYRALVTFIIEKNVWKISDIEILDARRLY